MHLTQTALQQLLNYDPITGQFSWATRVSQRCKPGDPANGRDNGNGYRQITLQGEAFMAHRLAWLYVYGEWPKEEIDHINGNRSDNRITNLRKASRKQNMENKRLYRNSTSGVRGVSWDKKSQKWRAHIRSNGKSAHLGFYEDLGEASAAARAARLQTFTHNTTADMSP